MAKFSFTKSVCPPTIQRWSYLRGKISHMYTHKSVSSGFINGSHCVKKFCVSVARHRTISLVQKLISASTSKTTMFEHTRIRGFCEFRKDLSHFHEDFGAPPGKAGGFNTPCKVNYNWFYKSKTFFSHFF